MITKYKFLIITILSSIILISCEKGLDTVEYDSTVYLPSAGITEVTPLLGESIYQIGIYWAGINVKESGITVYLKVDADSLARYLAEKQSDYKLLPETYYDIPVTTVNLADDRSLVNIHLKNIDDRFTGNNYILPISIESVNPLVNVAPSKKTIFLNFTRFRNIYEGTYKVFGPITSEDNEVVSTVDEVADAVSTAANTIKIKGAENNMNILLTVKSDGVVAISSAPGSESYQVTNMEGYKSVFTGSFDNQYQRAWGVFDLYYQYTLGITTMYVHAQLKSWQ